MLFSFFLLWKKKSFSRTSKLILKVHKKGTYSTKDQKAIKVLGKSTEDVYKWVNDDRIDIYGWIIIFKHSLLVLQLYISIKYITLTWCAEIHIFVMLPSTEIKLTYEMTKINRKLSLKYYSEVSEVWSDGGQRKIWHDSVPVGRQVTLSAE